MRIRTVLSLAAFTSSLACPALAQEFATPLASGSAGGDLLERGLSPVRDGLELSALQIGRPLGLSTRSLAAYAGSRGVRLALGLSRSGDDVLGWSAIGGAVGAGFPGGGVALRGVARRDEAPVEGEAWRGYEAGGGAWLGSANAAVWISAPQVWTHGMAPPLARGLSLGVRASASGIHAGLAREAPRRGFAEPASWSARLGLELGPVAAWGEAREHPWRAGVGLGGRAGPLRCVAQVDAHPVLAPTTRLVIQLGGSGGP